MVFAVLTEPTRYVPGLPVSAEVTLANPDRIEVDLLVWSCLANGRGACIGSDEAPLLSDPVVVTPAGLQTRVSLNDPAAALYDQARAAAPLRPADDAIVLDTTASDADAVFAQAMGIVRAYLAK
jgi:hypothetical protein